VVFLTRMLFTCTVITMATFSLTPVVNATTQSSPGGKLALKYKQTRLEETYHRMGQTYDVPWALLAAIDRYAELTKSKQDKRDHPAYGFYFQSSAWSGIDNPNIMDTNPMTIRLFQGLGVDANHDGLALPWDETDRVAVLARWLDSVSGEGDDATAVWDLFQDPIAMDRIYAFENIFGKYGLNPKDRCFPISKKYNYTVKHSFGAARSFGGRRSHEGVDIFAGYGTPVLACSYGYVELMGWNRLGGWRIGVRDADNFYYYYAHMSAFSKGLHQGDLVKPGEVIGYVGSTGYGPPGTSGKFPPHLHFGIYRDTGAHEWSFSPSGLLAQWARETQHISYPETEKSYKITKKD